MKKTVQESVAKKLIQEPATRKSLPEPSTSRKQPAQESPALAPAPAPAPVSAPAEISKLVPAPVSISTKAAKSAKASVSPAYKTKTTAKKTPQISTFLHSRIILIYCTIFYSLFDSLIIEYIIWKYMNFYIIRFLYCFSCLTILNEYYFFLCYFIL